MNALHQATLAKLPKPRQLLQLPLLTSLLSSIEIGLRPTAPSCPNPQLSCQDPSTADTCCFNDPGGLFFQTQFWDATPQPIGPENSWTLHGLWPSYCDGHTPFLENCDPDREFQDIRGILSSFQADSLIEYMETYMLPNEGTPNHFWAHEWNTHGTCASTLNPECYPDDPDPHRGVLDFFNITTALFGTLDTYATLAADGILPSDTQTYSLDQLLAPLAARHGAPVILKCKESALNQVFYAFSVRGALQSAQFVPTNPIGDETECPDDGIQYLPKSGGGD